MDDQIVAMLKYNGLTHTSDGLLFDLLSRGLYSGALSPLNDAISRRLREIEVLKDAEKEVKKRIQVTEIQKPV